MPEELSGLVTDFSVLFPWGSLLRAVASADRQFLDGLQVLAAEGASFRAVFSYEPSVEKKVMEEFALPELCPASLDKLKQKYREAGFKLSWRMIPQEELKRFPTTWAKRLAYGRPRPVVEFKGKTIAKVMRSMTSMDGHS